MQASDWPEPHKNQFFAVFAYAMRKSLDFIIPFFRTLSQFRKKTSLEKEDSLECIIIIDHES